MAQELEQAIIQEPALQKELEAIFQELDALRTAQSTLKEDEREWFVTTLEKELRQRGQWEKYQAVLHGDSSALTQGTDNIALAGIQTSGPMVVATHGAQVQVSSSAGKAEDATDKKRKPPL